MNSLTTISTIKLPNLILIAGNGRNVGKTFLACKIIHQLSQKHEVYGLKITPHFHSFIETDVLFKNEKFIIVNETQINSKDSSLFLQAGARKVLFVMTKQEHLTEAFEYLQNHFLSNQIIICESGGLHELVTPGLFFFVKKNNEQIVKTQLLRFSPILVNNNGKEFDFDTLDIEF